MVNGVQQETSKQMKTEILAHPKISVFSVHFNNTEIPFSWHSCSNRFNLDSPGVHWGICGADSSRGVHQPCPVQWAFSWIGGSRPHIRSNGKASCPSHKINNTLTYSHSFLQILKHRYWYFRYRTTWTGWCVTWPIWRYSSAVWRGSAGFSTQSLRTMMEKWVRGWEMNVVYWVYPKCKGLMKDKQFTAYGLFKFQETW